jgi:NitT/TauT family transport system substrate-binding protein
MLDRGIVDSGDTLTKGIGAMDAERIAGFLAEMQKAGVYAAGEVDPGRGYTLDFVNKGVGLDAKRKLVAASAAGR